MPDPGSARLSDAEARGTSGTPARYQESRIRHFHATLEAYLARSS